MFVAGCGSDDIIDSAMRAFGEARDEVRFADPTFSMIPRFALTNGLRPAGVELGNGLERDSERLLEGNPGIIYLCSPNNPTGATLETELFRRVVDGARGLVIIDEAYIEFGGESAVGLVASGRVLVTRTMSKAFGLAGLRIGYGIGSAEIVTAVSKARGPYKVSAAAESVAVAVLANDGEWVERRIAEVREIRARFTRALDELGYDPIPSAANFVLVPVVDSASVARRLRESGIAVRPFSNLTGIGDAIRISIGPWEMMQPCLAALGDLK